MQALSKLRSDLKLCRINNDVSEFFKVSAAQIDESKDTYRHLDSFLASDWLKFETLPRKYRILLVNQSSLSFQVSLRWLQ